MLRRTGAAVDDVAALIGRRQPDLLLLQEAVEAFENLPSIVGGYFYRHPLPSRIHGLAAWSPEPLNPGEVLALPASQMPGRQPPRIAQIVRLGDVTFANVHLSHGQFLNRRQLARIARSISGPAAIIGDFNAVGPTMLQGFRDVGPRWPTHRAGNVIPFRLDRCLVRDLHCARSSVLERGPSDHRPIYLDLRAGDEAIKAATASAFRYWLRGAGRGRGRMASMS